MELSDFVSNSLSEILVAIVKAQRFSQDHNIYAEIAPEYAEENGPILAGHEIKVHENGLRSRVVDVHFDVAVTVSDEQAAKAGAGIKVIGLALSLGASAETTAATSAASRISFVVPVILPLPSQVTVARIPGEAKRDSKS